MIDGLFIIITENAFVSVHLQLHNLCHVLPRGTFYSTSAVRHKFDWNSRCSSLENKTTLKSNYGENRIGLELRIYKRKFCIIMYLSGISTFKKILHLRAYLALCSG